MIVGPIVPCCSNLTVAGRESQENLEGDAFQDYGLLPTVIRVMSYIFPML